MNLEEAAHAYGRLIEAALESLSQDAEVPKIVQLRLAHAFQKSAEPLLEYPELVAPASRLIARLGGYAREALAERTAEESRRLDKVYQGMLEADQRRQEDFREEMEQRRQNLARLQSPEN